MLVSIKAGRRSPSGDSTGQRKPPIYDCLVNVCLGMSDHYLGLVQILGLSGGMGQRLDPKSGKGRHRSYLEARRFELAWAWAWAWAGRGLGRVVLSNADEFLWRAKGLRLANRNLDKFRGGLVRVDCQGSDSLAYIDGNGRNVENVGSSSDENGPIGEGAHHGESSGSSEEEGGSSSWRK
ncbi:hypothetical protein Sjap_004859 [Stephania japonica]|uniref:Uncharacterized protein n=1 Tax=Stephania japonica TaxID=461633 RepID=A0AAP0PLA3_9MAGN